MTQKKIAAIRVRGIPKLEKDVKDTLDLIRLYNKNYCSILDDTPSTRGMLKKLKDFITYGEIDDDTLKKLIEKRGQVAEISKESKFPKERKYIEYSGKKYLKYFRLNPPKKGYGRKGTKWPFTKSGALGYRGEKITDLILRMI